VRISNGLRKALITSLVFNATIATHVQAADETTAEPSIWGESTDVTIGLGASYGPRYLGSKNFVSGTHPLARIERGIFFLDSMDGLGVQWQSDSGFSASGSLGYDYGRADGDSGYRYGSAELKGMGEVSGATVLKLAASQQLTSWLALNTEAEMRVGGEKRGDRYSFGLESALWNSDSDKVTWGLDAHAGSGRFNQTYFGVTPEQRASSSFASFKADQGIYAYSSELSWLHIFDDHWSTIAGVAVTHFTDQVRNSPIVFKDTSSVTYLGLNYTF
jgi:outer membrane protein